MAYTGGEFHYPVAEFAAIAAATGKIPVTTVLETGSFSTSSTTNVLAKGWTVGSDGAALLIYRIDPDAGSSSGYLKAQINGVDIASMIGPAGSPSGSNHIVGLPFDDDHEDNVGTLFAQNGDVVQLRARTAGSGTIYVEWLYMEYDLV